MLNAVRARRIELVGSWDLAREFTEAVRRPKLARYEIQDRDVEDVIFIIGTSLPHVEIDVTLRDPDDAMVVAAAVFGRADAIVTGDADLLDDEALASWLAERRIDVLTPAELVQRLFE